MPRNGQLVLRWNLVNADRRAFFEEYWAGLGFLQAGDRGIPPCLFYFRNNRQPYSKKIFAGNYFLQAAEVSPVSEGQHLLTFPPRDLSSLTGE
jgi:hypothetical protein